MTTSSELHSADLRPEPVRSVPSWRFWVPLALQVVLILAVPAQAVYTYLSGRTVVLQTAPVDPYDFLRGYYQILSYQISQPATLEVLPGWAEVSQAADVSNPEATGFESVAGFYVILEAPTDAGEPPQPWKPVRVSRDRPSDLADNQVALRGRYQPNQIIYGLETYYMPEDQRDRVNQAIGEAQQTQPQSFVVEIKVDNQGNAVPLSLWVDEQNYRF